MTHLATWLWIVVGIVLYRMFGGTGTPIMEHAAGIYWSGVALLVHWASSFVFTKEPK